MRRNVLMCFAFICFFSCNQIKENKSSSKEDLIKTDSVKRKKNSKTSTKIVLGEDKDEINALVKGIYEINGEVFELFFPFTESVFIRSSLEQIGRAHV